MKTLELSQLTLAAGGHESRSDGLCLMEAVAWFANEPHSDHPQCTCPVLAQYGRGLNDILPVDKRQRLVPMIPLCVGTAGDGHEVARAMLAVDWLIRTYTPAWLRLAKLDADADALSALPPIDTEPDALAATAAINTARLNAAAAGDAAGAAAWDAARAAAWAAAGDAAGAAARAAAWAAARAAAGDAAAAAARDAAGAAARAAARAAAGDAAGAAAWAAARAAAGAAAGDAAGDAGGAAAGAAARAAARAAAWAAIAPTVSTMQDSAVDLFERMAKCGKVAP